MVNSVIFIMHRTILFNCMHILQKRVHHRPFSHIHAQWHKTKGTLRSHNDVIATAIAAAAVAATTSKQQLKNGEGHFNANNAQRFPYAKAKSSKK